MISRLLIAAFGAVAVTIGLLLFMNDVSNRFVLGDPIKYFSITDYIAAPDLGRQLPSITVTPESAPNRPRLDFEDEGSLSTEVIPLSPEMEGIMLFFPSTLQHQVYPFYNCDDVRISVSGNLSLDVTKEL